MQSFKHVFGHHRNFDNIKMQSKLSDIILSDSVTYVDLQQDGVSEAVQRCFAIRNNNKPIVQFRVFEPASSLVQPSKDSVGRLLDSRFLKSRTNYVIVKVKLVGIKKTAFLLAFFRQKRLFVIRKRLRIERVSNTCECRVHRLFFACLFQFKSIKTI